MCDEALVNCAVWDEWAGMPFSLVPQEVNATAVARVPDELQPYWARGISPVWLEMGNQLGGQTLAQEH
jgi:hypothetical protein